MNLSYIKFRWITNASFSLESDRTRVIFDPWGSETASFGSWFHFPLKDESLNEELFNKNYDAIFVTHHHTDHFDHKTILQIMKQNQNCKLFLAEASSKILSHPIKSLSKIFGESRVVVATDDQLINVGPFKITFYRSDFCDPKMCGMAIGCINPTSHRTRSIDSFVKIEVHDTRILNFNDSLIRLIRPTIKNVIKDVDVVMGLFGAAGPYPQCFPEMRNVPNIQRQTAWKFVEDLESVANTLNAKYIFPFSGQYLLGGKLVELNKYRGMIQIDEVHEYLNEKFESKKFSVSLDPYRDWLIPTKLQYLDITPKPEVEKLFNKLSYLKIPEYINKIKNKKFPYENMSLEKLERINLKQLLEKSSERYFRAIVDANVEQDHKVIIDLEPNDFSWFLDVKKRKYGVISKREVFEKNWTKMKIDSRLLYTTINRKKNFGGYTTAHWTNIHGGSHLEFTQDGYSAAALYFLNFFHT